MGLRAIPTNLCMAEAVPHGQRYNYHTTHPLEAVLSEDYFIPVKSMLRVGDEIRVCRIVMGRVRQLVDLLVVEIHPKTAEMHQISGVTEIPEGKAQRRPTVKREPENYIAADGRVEWNVGKRAYNVFEGDRLVAEARDKDEAWRIARGEDPLPEPEAA